MPPYQVTGDGLKSMILTFENFSKSRDWMRQASKIRSNTTTIQEQEYEESVAINLYYTYVPLVKTFVQEWGSDFVPSDIKFNLEEARKFWDQSPPNPHFVNTIMEHLTDELHNALGRQNEERDQDPN